VVPAAVVGTTQIVPVRCYHEELASFRDAARHFQPASAPRRSLMRSSG